MTVALPAGYLANDLFILNCMIRSNAETVTVSGWTAATGSPFTRGTTARYWIFYKLATSASDTAPLWDTDGSTADEYCVIAAYRNVNTATPIEVFGTATTGTADPAPVTGLTTLSANALVVVPLIAEDNLDLSIITTGTDPAAYVERLAATATGADAEVTFSEEARIAAGATGTISVNFNVGGAPGWGAMALALKPLGGGGTDGYNSLLSVATAQENPGANCANGGTKITMTSGLDNGDGGGTARDGVLQAGEIDATTVFYSCKGDTGATGAAGKNSVTRMDTLLAPTPCPYGGTRFRSGVDDDGDGILDVPGEVDFDTNLCNGINSVIKLTTVFPPDANCAAGSNGETKIEASTDTNGNGAPDVGEPAYYVKYVCGGIAGAAGQDGKDSLVRVEEELAGPNCPAGGLNVTWGLDDDGNGILAWTERDGIAFVCDGPAGYAATANTTAEPPGGNCTFGGLALTLGQNYTGNGSSPDVVLDVQYVCNGADGTGGGGSFYGIDPWLLLGVVAFLVLAAIGLVGRVTLVLLAAGIVAIFAGLRAGLVGLPTLVSFALLGLGVIFLALSAWYGE